LETIAYEDFSLALHQQLIARRVPVHGTIEITHRCPLKCVHCYNNRAIRDQETLSTELSFKEHCRIVDEIAEAGCFWLLYTGGEIFVRKDFLDIYTYAKQKGFLITLFTNGVLITENIADCLADWRPFSIEISLYGRTAETYEQVTRVPGSYERCMRGIRLLTDRNLPLKLKSMALTQNKHEIADMKRFVQEHLGLEFKFDAMVNPRLDCSKEPLKARLTPQEIVDLDLQDQDRVEEWKRFIRQVIRPVGNDHFCKTLYHCGAGLSTFSVDPAGGLSPCALAQGDSYDLRNGSFPDGWEGFLSRVREKEATRPNKCLTCQIKAMCGMCPANGELENGDPEEPVDFLCRVAHLRAKAFK
jgi:radical SAM protein with 4Fe4S-binding SPASM domain